MGLKQLFCNHELEHKDIPMTISSAFDIPIKKGVQRLSTCSKCGYHKTKWLYTTYKRKF